VTLGLAAALILALTPGVAAADDALTARLDAALSARALTGARIGALLIRERDGKVLYERSPDRALIPASNMKILTAIAALEAFGPTHRFETRILADRPPDANGRIGSMAVRGGGDPVLNSEDWWRLAADLRRLGLREIEGDLVVDDAAFDDEYWHPSWGRVSARAYHAPVAGLTANYGAFFVAVHPGAQKGDAVRIDVDPPIPYLKVSNLAATGAPRAKRSLVVDRVRHQSGGELVKVRGTVRAGGESNVFPRSVQDAALYAGAVLKMQLAANGIRVGGVVRRGPSDGHKELLLGFEGRPLSEIVRLFVKYSNNFIAESLVKSLGAKASGGQGSWPSGLAEMKDRLAKAGVNGDHLVFADGSGLSPANRVSARTLVGALRLAHRNFDFGPELMAALPIGAGDGTLERRAAHAAARLRAKTGLLSDQRVTTLSGFVHLETGELGVFSVLVNGYKGGTRDAIDAVDRFVAAAVR
jgi:D-alanyl-D-alanine carboxypeptidase/D-alanyl-D-alanine-endopeptidase (penicillin-binding protein 4)